MGIRARVSAGVAVLGLAVAMTALGASAAVAAAPAVAPPPVAAADESCWYAVDTGQSLCERVSGLKVDARSEAALAPAGALASTAVSTIYDDNNYAGGSYTMSVSSGSCATTAYGFTDIGPIGWYNRVSSFKSYGGCKTAVFSSTNYGGSSTGYWSSLSSVGSMNDLAKSWRVSG